MIESTMEAIVLRSDGKPVMERIMVNLSYDEENDPLVVTMTLTGSGREPVVWIVGRELMMRGVVSTTTYGDGDVRFRYEGAHRRRLMVCLRSNYGHADLGMSQLAVVQFLNRTADLCRLGDEPVGAILDRELADLFKEGDQA